jgi:hypothetical protein
MGQSRNRSWSTPEITVLQQGTPEEAVMTVCKQGNIYTASQNDYWGGCYAYGSYDPCNSVCSTLVNS